MEDTNITFVSNASSRSKSFGHNKFQVQIQEANSTIESLENIIKDKTEELELLKNNIKTFHLQLQDKNLEINQLKQDNKTYTKDIETLTFDLNKLNTASCNNESNFKKDYDILHDEKLHLLNTITQLNKIQNDNNNKYNDLKTKYQVTLELLENKSQDYNVLNSTCDNLLNELNLSKEINLKQEKEIDTIKQELFRTNNESSVLKTQLFEKDIALGQLHKKLALEQYNSKGKKYNINEEVEEQIQYQFEEQYDKDDDKDVIVSNKSVKLAPQRGIKLSRR
jgi:chromosome segregation ATPase